MDIMEVASRVALLYVPFLFAICFHEFAHGWVAKRLGDPTAEQMGRVSMNPLVHVDPLGTVVFPILALAGASPLFFGWAKPVPVNSMFLKNPRQDLFWIALAGPASNFLLAIIGLFLMGFKNYFPLGVELGQVVGAVLESFVLLNLFLAIFNLIPVHPLDGGKILARFLPASANYWLEKNSGTIGMLLLGFLILDGLSGKGARLISTPVFFLYGILQGVIGSLFLLS